MPKIAATPSSKRSSFRRSRLNLSGEPSRTATCSSSETRCARRTKPASLIASLLEEREARHDSHFCANLPFGSEIWLEASTVIGHACFCKSHFLRKGFPSLGHL